MTTGSVKFFNKKRGYGFIRDDETGKDIYAHISDLIDHDIKEKDKVIFDIKEEKTGCENKKAVNVKKNWRSLFDNH